MGFLIFSIHVTPAAWVVHQAGMADDNTHALFTRLVGVVVHPIA